MKKKKRKIKSGRIIAISAMLVSFLTLVLFVYQIRLQHSESRLSVTPRLSFSEEYSYENNNLVNQYKDTISTKFIVYSIYLENKGLGPAIIKSVDFINKKQKINIENFQNQHKKIRNYLNINDITTFSDGAILSQNDKIKLFELKVNRIYENKLYAIENISKLEEIFNIKVIYQSLYEELFEKES